MHSAWIRGHGTVSTTLSNPCSCPPARRTRTLPPSSSTDRTGRPHHSATPRYIALAPFAPRFPFETWILPVTRRAAYHTIDDDGEMMELAGLLKDTLGRLNDALDTPPYNLVLHTAPLGEPDLPYYHWHLEIMPKLTRVAGFEIGSGFYINPTPPEDAAQFLRDVGARA